ncbi:MAG: type IV pilus assembly protein PilM [Candidatus Sumerlaeia bacterium]
MALFSSLFSKPAVGLDIGTRLVKAVELDNKGKNIQLIRAGMAEIYPNGDKPKNPEAQRAAVVDAIKRAISSAGIKATNAVSAVAGESIIVRYIQVPEMPESELKNALRWEAEEYIPFRIDDVNIDSAVIGHSGEGDMKRMDVLLVCARKDHISDHVSIIRDAGLNPVVVDVDSFAFLNCYEVNYDTAPEDVVGLVNIGGDITSISVYAAGTPKFSRDISIGGNTITTALMQRMELSFQEAESLKVRHGAIPSEETMRTKDDTANITVDEDLDNTDESDVMETIRSTVEAMTGMMEAEEEDEENTAHEAPPELPETRIVQNNLNNLVGEIRRSIQFFENQSRGLKVNRLVLGGGSANLSGIDAYIQDALDLPVEILDPLVRIPASSKDIHADFLKDNKQLLSVSIGLALRKAVD